MLLNLQSRNAATGHWPPRHVAAARRPAGLLVAALLTGTLFLAAEAAAPRPVHASPNAVDMAGQRGIFYAIPPQPTYPGVLVNGRRALPATTRISVSTGGVQANSFASMAGLSLLGRYAVFSSAASNLVPGDTNRTSDAFLYDRRSGTTTRVSLSNTGAQSPGRSNAQGISADGRYVVFSSSASLVPGDTNDVDDTYVRDVRRHRTVLVSVSSSGQQQNDSSSEAAISGDGRYVTFSSYASNLVPGDTNDTFDIFVRDMRTGRTTRVSVGDRGQQADSFSLEPTISADCRYVGFMSYATNLVPGDTNDTNDAFLHDLRTGRTTRVSVSNTGEQADGHSSSLTLSANGRFAAFFSVADNLVPGDTNEPADVFVRDRWAGTTTLVSVPAAGGVADGPSFSSAISADGRFVAYLSEAPNMVTPSPGTIGNIYVRDRWTRTTTLVSNAANGAQANSSSWDVTLSGDGRSVGFTSSATNLVRGDTNGQYDAFVRGPRPR
jgi:archaellum component FlaF (FlaF/FlaG flagellin family)